MLIWQRNIKNPTYALRLEHRPVGAYKEEIKMTRLTAKIAAMVLVALIAMAPVTTMAIETKAAELSAPATISTVIEPSDYVCVMTKEEAEERVVITEAIEVEDTAKVTIEPEYTYVQFILNRMEKLFQGEIGFDELIEDIVSW